MAQPWLHRSLYDPVVTKMITDMQLHRLAPGTQALYLREVASLAAYYGRSPDQLTSDEIRAYLHHLLVERQLAWSTCNVTAAAIRFFYVETLGWSMAQLHLPPRTDRQRLPRVLSAEELQRLYPTHAARHPKHLADDYRCREPAGQRGGALDADIESERMCIRVNQGKGNKDRYTLLSTRLLTELRAYWKLFRPPRWLFPGRLPPADMPSGTAHKIYEQAASGRGYWRGRAFMRCATALPHISSTRGRQSTLSSPPGASRPGDHPSAISGESPAPGGRCAALWISSASQDVQPARQVSP